MTKKCYRTLMPSLRSRMLAVLCLLCLQIGMAQQTDPRIATIENRLTILATDNPGFTEQVKTEINVSQITLGTLLLGISEVHKININVDQSLNQISLSNNFPNVTVAELLVFLCKEYNLTIDFTGSILAVKPFIAEVVMPEERIIPVVYDPNSNRITMDVKGDKLYDVFKRITDETGKNLVFTPGLENRPLTAYMQQTPLEAALDKLALGNNLYVEQSKDGFFVFEDNAPSVSGSATGQGGNTQNMIRPKRTRGANFFFKILDPETKRLEVDFVNTPIAAIINDIALELKLDVFTAAPLDEAGMATFKAKDIYFDDLLRDLFESQQVSKMGNGGNNSGRNVNANNASGGRKASGHFSFKKEGNVYYFGKDNQLLIRTVAVIHLQHRSVELLSDPSGNYNPMGGSLGGASNSYGNTNSYGGTNTFNSNQQNSFSGSSRQTLNTQSTGSFNSHGSKAEALVNILPDELKQDLDIKVDFELNSFYVNGPSDSVERFKRFVDKIDKPVPVILIEAMLIEVDKSSNVETGVSWGIAEAPVTTQGGIFPETDITLGANTINKVIGGFDGFGSLNIGKVVPNFFATIKAMESNGDLKVRSTPKLSTLNGHRATFSNGQRSYYAVTTRNIYGTDNPQTSEITNYYPIDAELGLTIKPLVSGDGHVTLDIFVVQSSFGNRIDEDAPPDLNSRTFSSLIRVKDQDIVVLGGLEENLTSNSGSGVPFLARIPIIKWLFSKRKREARKAKLTVLIKPTIIY